MSFFRRKKEEVFINNSKKKGKRLLPEADSQDLSKHFGEDAVQEDEDLYPLPLPADEPEQVTQKKPKKKEKKQKEKNPPQLKPPFYRSKLFIGSTCVVVASLISFVLVPIMSYVTTTEMTTVIRATAPIAKGTKIEASMLQTVSVPALNVSRDTLRQPDHALGQYAAVDMIAGDLLMTPKLTEVMPFPDDYLYSIPAGKQAISATIPSFAEGLSGKLQAGDIVSVFAVPKQNDAKEEDYNAILPPELNYVRVLAVTNKLSLDKQAETSSQEDTEDKGVDEEQQPVTVTLLVNSQQAAAVVGLNVNAHIHMSLVCRGNESAALELLQLQEEYLLEEPEEIFADAAEITEPVDAPESVVSKIE